MGDWVMGNYELQFFDDLEYSQEIEIIAVDCNLACEDEEVEEGLLSQSEQEEKEADIVEAPPILHPPSELPSELVTAAALSEELREADQEDHEGTSHSGETPLQERSTTHGFKTLNSDKIKSLSLGMQNFDLELKPSSPRTFDRTLNQESQNYNTKAHHKELSPTKTKESLVNPDLKENCNKDNKPVKLQNRNTAKKTLSPKQNQAEDNVHSRILKREIKIVIEPLKLSEIPSLKNHTYKIDTNVAFNHKESILKETIKPPLKRDAINDFQLQFPSKRIKLSKLKLVKMSPSAQQSGIDIETLISLPLARKASTVEAHPSTSDKREVEMMPVNSLSSVKENCRTPKELVQFLKSLECETTVAKPQSVVEAPPEHTIVKIESATQQTTKPCCVLLDRDEVSQYISNQSHSTVSPKLILTQQIRSTYSRWKRQAPCPGTKKRGRPAKKTMVEAEEGGKGDLETLRCQGMKVEAQEIITASTSKEGTSRSSTPEAKDVPEVGEKITMVTPPESEVPQCSSNCDQPKMSPTSVPKQQQRKVGRPRLWRKSPWPRKKKHPAYKKATEEQKGGLEALGCESKEVETQEIILLDTLQESSRSSTPEVKDVPAVGEETSVVTQPESAQAEPTPPSIAVEETDPSSLPQYDVKTSTEPVLECKAQVEIEPLEQHQCDKVEMQPSDQIVMVQIEPSRKTNLENMPSEQLDMVEIEPLGETTLEKKPSEQISTVEIEPSGGTTLEKKPSEQTTLKIEPFGGTTLEKKPSEQTSTVEIEPSGGTTLEKKPSEQTTLKIEPFGGTTLENKPSEQIDLVELEPFGETILENKLSGQINTVEIEPSGETTLEKKPSEQTTLENKLSEQISAVEIEPFGETTLEKKPSEQTTLEIEPSVQISTMKIEPFGGTSLENKPSEQTTLEIEPFGGTTLEIEPFGGTTLEIEPSKQTIMVEIEPSERISKLKILPAERASMQEIPSKETIIVELGSTKIEFSNETIRVEEESSKVKSTEETSEVQTDPSELTVIMEAESTESTTKVETKDLESSEQSVKLETVPQEQDAIKTSEHSATSEMELLLKQIQHRLQDCSVVLVRKETCEQPTPGTSTQLQKDVGVTRPCSVLLDRKEVQKFLFNGGYKYYQLDSKLEKRNKKKQKGLVFSSNLSKRKHPTVAEEPKNKTEIAHTELPMTSVTNYKCSTCGKKFLKLVNLKRHITYFDHRPMCVVCKQKFCNLSSLRRHEKKLHAKDEILKVQCEKCYTYFDTHHQLQKHELTHRPYICHSCGKNCEQKVELEEHILTIHLIDGNLSCEYCGKWFFELFHLKRHVEIVHKINTKSYCKICRKGFLNKTNYNDHLKFCGNTKKIIKSFSSSLKPILKDIRINIKVSNKLTKCYQCHGLFTNIKRHSLVHTNEKPFKCPICFKEFSRKYSMKMHFLAVHKNIMSLRVKNIIKSFKFYKTKKGETFTCYLCSKSFGNKGSLVIHIQHSHTIEEIENCKPLYNVENKRSETDMTTKSLSSGPNVERNQISENKNETPVTSKIQSNTNTHHARNSIESDMACTICKELFSSEQTIRNHYTIVHKESFDDSHDKRKIAKQSSNGNFTTPDKESYCTKTWNNEYRCNVCDKMYTYKANMRSHFLTVHSKLNKKFVVEKIEEKEISEQNPKTKLNDKSGETKCFCCGESFVDFNLYKNHVRNHSLSCHICHTNYSTLTNLRRHFQCMHYSSKTEDLSIHHVKFSKQKHKYTKEKVVLSKLKCKLQCKRCKKYFARSANLRKHKLMNSCGLKTNYCYICKKTFHSIYSLSRHNRSKHKTWTKKPVMKSKLSKTIDKTIKSDLECNNCSISDTTNHKIQEQNYSQLKINCIYCNEYFMSVEELSEHVSKMHKVTTDTEIFVQLEVSDKITNKFDFVNVSAIPMVTKVIPMNTDNDEASQLKIVVDKFGIVKYECRKCSKIFDFPYLVKAHELTCYVKVKTHVCIYCKNMYVSQLTLNCHVRKKHPDKFKSETQSLIKLNANYVIKEPEKQNFHELDQQKNVLKCNHCLLEFKHNDDLTRHIITKHTDIKCQRSRKINILGKNKKFIIHSSKKEVTCMVYNCSECAATFLSNSALEQHKLTHNVSVPCPQCFIVFENTELLQKHKSCVHDSLPPSPISTNNKNTEIIQSNTKFIQPFTINTVKTVEKPLVFVKLRTITKNENVQVEKTTVPQTNNLISEEIQPFLHFVQQNSQLHLNQEKIIMTNSIPALETSYKCQTCYFNYTTEDSLKEHELIHKTKNTLDFEKIKIENTLSTKEILNKHENTKLTKKNSSKQNIKRHECNYCQRIFTCRISLTRHLCEKYRESLKQQDLKKTVMPPPLIPLCETPNVPISIANSISPTQPRLFAPLPSKYFIQPLVKISEQSTSSPMNHHPEQLVARQPVLLTPYSSINLQPVSLIKRCPVSIIKRPPSSYHTQSCQSKKLKYECLDCEKKFAYKNDFSRHLVYHRKQKTERVQNSNYKPLLHFPVKKQTIMKQRISDYYTCKLCDIHFISRFDYKKHELIHKNLQTFTCQYCDQSFSTFLNLKIHKKAFHLVDEDGPAVTLIKYQCKQCDVKFTDKFIMNRHLNSVHDIWEERVTVSLDLETISLDDESYDDEEDIVDVEF